MRILFLDFDGVLNTENYQAQLRAEGKPGWDDFGSLFDPAAVANLKRILGMVFVLEHSPRKKSSGKESDQSYMCLGLAVFQGCPS